MHRIEGITRQFSEVFFPAESGDTRRIPEAMQERLLNSAIAMSPEMENLGWECPEEMQGTLIINPRWDSAGGHACYIYRSATDYRTLLAK